MKRHGTPLSLFPKRRPPALLPVPAFGTGKAILFTPEFSGHEMHLSAAQKAKQTKGLKGVPADSRPPQVVEVQIVV